MLTRTPSAHKAESQSRDGPEHALEAFTGHLADGNIPASAACFTRDACLITADRTEVHGRDGVAGVLAQLVARHTEVEIEQLVVREAGAVALAGGRWTMRSDGPEGSRFVQASEPTLVLRQVEKTWKIAIVALGSASGDCRLVV